MIRGDYYILTALVHFFSKCFLMKINCSVLCNDNFYEKNKKTRHFMYLYQYIY